MLRLIARTLALSFATISTTTLAQSPVSLEKVPSSATDAPFRAAIEDLASRGFVENEFLLAGTARGISTEDRSAESAPYKTRILIRRPVDPNRFNGVVIVEWLNVSAGYELEMGWPMFGEELLRGGYAWVGVSAQPVGTGFLKNWRPSRYASLNHPGLTTVEPAANGRLFLNDETWSFDIFRQVASGLTGKRSRDLFGKKPNILIAYGGSQSAGRLVEFLNRVPAADDPFAGYFLNVAGSKGVPLSPRVPVFFLNSEREVVSNLPGRRPDGPTFRYWEVAGAGHFSRLAQEAAYNKAIREIPQISGPGKGEMCGVRPGPAGTEYVSRAVVRHLAAWIMSGKGPPHAEPVATVKTAGAVQIATDGFGNALGGVRLPLVAVPTGVVKGMSAPEGDIGRLCQQISGFVPFTKDEIDRLYPSHYEYVGKVKEAAEAAVKSGYLLSEDANLLVQQAEMSEIGELRAPALAPAGSWRR